MTELEIVKAQIQTDILAALREYTPKEPPSLKLIHNMTRNLLCERSQSNVDVNLQVTQNPLNIGEIFISPKDLYTGLLLMGCTWARKEEIEKETKVVPSGPNTCVTQYANENGLFQLITFDDNRPPMFTFQPPVAPEFIQITLKVTDDPL